MIMRLIKSNITFHRGDARPIKLVYPDKDLTSLPLQFVVKLDRKIISSRLVQISSNEPLKFSMEFDEKIGTTITITPAAEDTADLEAKIYVYDIIDTESLITYFDGSFKLEGDVQTPYDGTDLPEEAQRYIPVLPDQFNDDEIVQKKTTGGKATFSGKKIIDAKDFDDGTIFFKTTIESKAVIVGGNAATIKLLLALNNVQNLDQTNPDIILQNEDHRFVNDQQIDNWNSKYKLDSIFDLKIPADIDNNFFYEV